jgi:putative transposase
VVHTGSGRYVANWILPRRHITGISNASYILKCSQREKCDAQIIQEIKRVYGENYSVYGARKVWRQLLREGFSVARCTVERLMKIIGLRGVLRGKVIKTTIGRKTAAAADLVNRQFVAERPNQLWCADFTYVAPGMASPMWRSSSMCSQARSLAGGSHRRWKQGSCWMLWNKLCGHVALRYNPSLGQGLPIRVTGVHSGCRRRSCWRRQAVQATLTIMPWPRVSMAFTKRVIHRKSWKNLGSGACDTGVGWTGSTIEGYWNG